MHSKPWKRVLTLILRGMPGVDGRGRMRKN